MGGPLDGTEEVIRGCPDRLFRPIPPVLSASDLTAEVLKGIAAHAYRRVAVISDVARYDYDGEVDPA